MMKMLFLVAALLAFSAAQSNAQPNLLCWEEGWKIDSALGTYNAEATAFSTYGTWFNRYKHEEYMWVHSGTNIDFYSLTDKGSFDASDNPTLTYSYPAGSTCLTGESTLIGDLIITVHGDDAFCTCNWRPEAPCPSELKIAIAGQPEFNIKLSSNTNVPVDTVVPDVIAPPAIPIADGSDGSPPNWACTTLTNPEEMAGKWCLADRGGCYFQTKYERCMEAGAIGAMVINRDNSVLAMGVREIQPNDIFFMVGKDDMQPVKDAINAGIPVTLSAGRGVGPAAPYPEYTQPDAMGVINVYTGQTIVDKAPFLLTESIIYDPETMLLYAFSIDGNRPAQHIVMNMTLPVDGSYPVVGSLGAAFDRTGWDIIKNDKGTFFVESVAWNNQFLMYDANGPNAVSPQLIGTYDLQQLCPLSSWKYSGPQIHPTGNYLYYPQGLRTDVCPDFDGDGIAGDYVQEIYDISDPYNVFFVKGFTMDEVEVGAVTINGGQSRWEWGQDGIAGISATSGGFFLYDFSDPENPVIASQIYDPAENTGDFTRGVLSSRYGDDGFWYLYEKDGVDGVHGEYHQLKAVPCDMPAICKAYD